MIAAVDGLSDSSSETGKKFSGNGSTGRKLRLIQRKAQPLAIRASLSVSGFYVVAGQSEIVPENGKLVPINRVIRVALHRRKSSVNDTEKGRIRVLFRNHRNRLLSIVIAYANVKTSFLLPSSYPTGKQGFLPPSSSHRVLDVSSGFVIMYHSRDHHVQFVSANKTSG